MIARQFITEPIIPLKTSDSGSFAIAMMEEYHVSHLPIVNETEYLGLIAEADLYSFSHPEEPLADQQIILNRPFVEENQHIYEIIRTMSELKLTILPVLDSDQKYLGVISINDLFFTMSEILAIENPGGIIILEMNEKDYVLTEIAQIIESNDARILNLFITSLPDLGKIEVTIKVNKIDVGPLLQTFSRYSYHVKASYTENTYDEGLQDRFDSLMNYLNV